METLKVENFGPIRTADVTFGDLTFLVGAQASGKSLFLELAKLVEDRAAIVANLKKYNYIINRNNLLDAYFGSGMAAVWTSDTKVAFDGKAFSSVTSLMSKNEAGEEKVFYVPAQRIFSISDGRPKAFSEFDPSAPYTLRQFSETLRVFMSVGLGGNAVLFPVNNRLKNLQKKSFDGSIFHGGKVVMEDDNGQRKMRLKTGGMNIPFMTWSAGQKEFLPLLMAFYCVSGSPVQVMNKDQYECVIIEEPEMGLHPQAIMSVLLEILQLVQMGKKVIVSTHSTVPLEFVWAFNILKKSPKSKKEAAAALMKLFDGSAEGPGMLSGIFGKDIRTYAFVRNDDEKVTSFDITSLDAFDENKEVCEWGGLSSFATRASELVSEYCDG